MRRRRPLPATAIQLNFIQSGLRFRAFRPRFAFKVATHLRQEQMLTIKFRLWTREIRSNVTEMDTIDKSAEAEEAAAFKCDSQRSRRRHVLSPVSHSRRIFPFAYSQLCLSRYPIASNISHYAENCANMRRKRTGV